MSRIIARFCILTCCCLFVTLGAFGEDAPLTLPPSNGCGRVHIYIESRPAVVKKGGVACERGELAGIFPSEADTGLVVLEQSPSYGPDCAITITSGSSTSFIRVQQNYCMWEAGDLSPSVVAGPAKILRYESGSFAKGRPGQVWVTTK